jgi:hypothetical protein
VSSDAQPEPYPTTDGGPGPRTDAGSSPEGGIRPGCAGQALVYVLSAQNDLYSFAPATKQFHKVGTINCATPMQANSMAVDRAGNAYVNYVETGGTGDTGGSIYRVSTQDASCTGLVMNLPNGLWRVGMAFSADSASSASETLYVIAAAGTSLDGLNVIDLVNKTAGAHIGSFTGALTQQTADLTGTGDGTLFGLFATTPLQLAQIDKATAATSSPHAFASAGAAPTQFAFSYWGGHFYLYTSQGSGSTVTDYNPATGATDAAYVANVGFDIVGAGVSTCAP